MGQAIGHFGEKLTFKICKRILDKIMVKFEMELNWVCTTWSILQNS